MLQCRTKLSFGYLNCTAMHYAIKAGPCAVPCALHRLGTCSCFAYACMMCFLLEALLLDEALKVFYLLGATHKEWHPLMNLLWADVQHTLLSC